MWWLLVDAAIAGWTPAGTAHDCTFSKGDPETVTVGPATWNDVVPFRAECAWPFRADKVTAVLGDPQQHPKAFRSVVEGHTVGTVSGGVKVWQLHRTPGLGDQEVVLVMTSAGIEGGRRYEWRNEAPAHASEPGTLDIEIWEVTDAPDGCKVTYEVRYVPEGKVGATMARMFQKEGIKGVMGELRSWAVSH